MVFESFDSRLYFDTSILQKNYLLTLHTTLSQEVYYTRRWQYDDQNRIIQEKGYDYDKLAYIEDYHYFDGGYKYSTIYYDYNGNAVPPKYSDIEFSPIYTSTYYLDKKGKIIKEDITTEKGVKISTEITYYDTKSRIIRTLYQCVDEHFINANKQPEITHIFEYK